MDRRELNVPAVSTGIADEAIATVQRWLSVTDVMVPPAEVALSKLLEADGGPQFAIDFIDGVLRPEDSAVAAANLERISRAVPSSVRWHSEIGTLLVGGFAPLLPSAIVPLARESFIRSIAHLFVRLDVQDLGKQLTELLRRGGIRPTLNPLTATASGDREAQRQVDDVRELVERSDVDSVSLRLSAVLGRIRHIDLEAEVERAVELLIPLYESAGRSESPTLMVLEVDSFAELEPSLRVFERMLALQPDLDMGISLPAYLPDSLPALRRVIDLARTRRAAGGASATVRFTRGDQLGEERAIAASHGWPAAPFASRAEISGQFLRLLDFSLTPARTSAVRVISATEELFATAFAWRLARSRGVERRLEHEFILGSTSHYTDAVKRDVGGVRLNVPVVHAGQLPLAAAYLVRRIRDLAGIDGGVARADFRDPEELFLDALAASRVKPVATNRTQEAVRSESADFTVAATREWAKGVLERAKNSATGEALLARSVIGNSSELEKLIQDVVSAGASWSERRGSTRATVVESVAEVLAEWRGLLVETEISESGVTMAEADGEVTVAIGLARRAASNARELDSVTDAIVVPPKLVVVVVPRSSPITELAGKVFTALAAGSAVIVKTAPETRRSSAVFIDTLLAGGVPAGLVAVLDDEGDLARELLSDARVDHILHAGSRHTAKLFHSWRAETPLSSTTGGRNSIIVTPNADLESAVSDIVDSALDHAGQAPTAASTVILVGSVGESARFLGRLADAVASVPVAAPGTPGAGLSALARPAGEREIALLDTLEEGETWKVRPRNMDGNGRLWSPGLREGVESGSPFRRLENRAPVLGIVCAHTLGDAIEIQNALGFGLAAGIHSLDALEVETWISQTQAGLLSVNRSMTTELRARVPMEGWNRSVVGIARAEGGQDAALALGRYEPVSRAPGTTVTLDGLSDPVARFIGAAQAGLDFSEFDWIRAGARNDELAWRSVYATSEIAQSAVERTIRRYRPLPVTIRLSEGAPVAHLVRVLAAATLSRAAVAVSTPVPLHDGLITLFGESDSPVGVAQVLVESDARWRARVQAGDIATTRIRLIGGEAVILSRVMHGRSGIALHSAPVTTSGRIELLPFLREQAICINTQRFGVPDPILAKLGAH
ncbi:MAG: proline dehydrogenase family protein [Terrimesophilobacter sp.]